MSFRITTNGMFRSYRANLTRSTKNLNDAMTRVQTERYFNSYAEDPAAANRAFQLRRSYWNNGNQMDNSKYVISKFSVGFDALDSIVDGDTDHPGLDGILESLRAITGTAGAGRKPLGQSLVSTADAIASVMNVHYGDEYVFAGADGLNPPFSWAMEDDGSYKLDDDGNKILLYRGVPVDEMEEDDDIVQQFLSEATLVDIGLGFRLQEDGTINPATAYNSALSGIEILGYGKDEDDDPVNLAALMMKLGGIFNRCDADSGAYATDKDKEDAERLVGKLRSAIARVQEQHVKLDGKVDYLNKNLGQLEDNKLNLNEDIENVERMDMAAAIGDMMWAQYSYNAALQIGTKVLSQSLFDYFG